MAKRKKYVLADLPDAGTVFAMPLADGRVGVCRVLRKAEQDIPCTLIAASDWISSGPPPLNHPAVRRTLLKNHHNWTNSPEIFWVPDPPPKEFRVMGKIALGSKDAAADSNSYGHWDSASHQVLAQWRWDHDRAAVLLEDEQRKADELARRNQANRERAERLASVRLSTLLKEDLFPTWDDYPPEAATEGCRQIIHAFIRKLAEAKEPLKRSFVSKELKKCVEELNQFESRNDHFIETIERDDLYEVLADILSAVKFPELLEKVNDWRDW